MHETTKRLALVLALAGLAPGSASALDILLTNDDGFAFVGINTLRAALCAAGHHVTMVAPATDQSGRGGSINTRALSSAGAMPLTKLASDACGDSYSLAAPPPPTFGGTPVDSLRAGLNVVLAGDPPDLVLSGLNFGQNMSKPTSNASGTVGAALQGALVGIPAIAGSVGVLFSENPVFGSTVAAFPPASAFMVSVIAALEAEPGDALLPPKVSMLNINFPVPYGNITGVAITKLADRSDLELPLFDRRLGFPPFVPPNPALPSCATLAVGEACSVGVGVAFPPGPDEESDADTDAQRANLISITPMDGDMAVSGGKGFADVEEILGGLTP
jgi:5'/3'-nucleotidase SurE